MSISRCDYHDTIIDLMKELGYSAHVEGVCRGITMMGIQACIADDIETFNERLEFITDNPNLVSNIRKLSERNKDLPISPDERRIIDVIAFFDGIELHQYPEHHQDIFGKYISQANIAEISNLTLSIQLEKKDGLAKAMSWPGIYNSVELNNYMEMLNAVASSLKQPFSLLFESNDHSTALYYDPKLPGWYMLDSDELPIQAIDIDLATWIKECFSENGDITAFETSIFVAKNSSEIGKSISEKIKTSVEFAALHQITQEKANYVNSSGLTLAYLAANGKYVDVINALSALDADLNKPVDNGMTPLYVAADHGDVDTINALIAGKADPNQFANEETPLLIAAQEGHAGAIKALIAAGADVNKPKTSTGSTPTFIAAQCGQLDAVNAFIAAKADLAKPRNDGLTPAFMAAQNGYVEILNALANAGVDLNHKTPSGTPIEVAQEVAATSCIQFLNKYNVQRKKHEQARLFSQADAASPEGRSDDTRPEKRRK